MKKYSIKFTHDIFKHLKDYLLGCPEKKERRAFVYCHMARAGDRVIIYPKKTIRCVDDEDPNIISSTHSYKLSKDLRFRFHIDFVESEYDCLLSIHSHPFEEGQVWFSGTDDRTDNEFFPHCYKDFPRARNNINRSDDVEVLSMVFGQHTIGARGYDPKTQAFVPVEKIVVMDKTVKTIFPTNKPRITADCRLERQRLDRQILAFGDAGRDQLKDVRVGIIGCGGTGSIIAEGISRLGVKNIVLVDEDKLDLSNLNRWQGGMMDDVGKKKTDILKERLSTMAPNVSVTAVNRSVLCHEAIEQLKTCDCILGCVDTHHIRFFLNRFSTQYLIPYLDCSTGIIMDEVKIAKIGSRIAAVIPSVTRCMDCSEIEYYKAEDVQNKFTDNETYRNLKRNKYIQDEDNSIHAPAVYPVNMLTCSILLMEFMNLFWGFKPVFWNTYLDYLSFSKETQYSCDQEMHPESASEDCLYCNEYIGTGDSESLEYFFGGEKEIVLPDAKLAYTPPIVKEREPFAEILELLR